MDNVGATIAPLLLVAFIGFAIAKARVISHAELAGLGRFLVVCAVPALLFGAVLRSELSEFRDYAFPAVFASSGLVAGVSCYLVCKKILGLPAIECSTLALGSTFPNSIAIGFPMAQQLLGVSVLPLFAVVVLVETLVFLPLGLLVLETASTGTSSGRSKLIHLARRVIQNPILLAIIAGLCVSSSPVTIPAAANEAIELLGRSVAATALFFAGGLVAHANISIVGPATLVACAAKLALAPGVAAILAICFIPDQPVIVAAAVLFAAAPTFSSLPAISAPYGTEHAAANVQGLSSALALLTIPGVALVTTVYLGH